MRVVDEVDFTPTQCRKIQHIRYLLLAVAAAALVGLGSMLPPRVLDRLPVALLLIVVILACLKGARALSRASEGPCESEEEED